ncbi:MAG TPA: COX15/CtaA family protein [Terriglobales bacterium]|nr:COX15/CtaA family protein [Terriglobales bacterium]
MSSLSASLPQASAPACRRRRGFAVYAWATLGYNLLVILWGAYVRAAGAGNGCGDNWPLCDGQFLPAHPQVKMLIEFLHRVSSGVDAVLVAGLVAGALWLYPKPSAVRRGAGWAGVFIVTEALLGAALVLFGWVGRNASAARVAADALHLANTLLLLAAVALTAAWAAGLPARGWRGPGRTAWLLGGGLAGVVATGMAGVMAALADTLFPATSLSAGLRQDFSGSAAVLQRVRVIHPAVAVGVGLYLLWLVIEGLPRPESPVARRLGYGVIAAVLVQWTSGVLDMSLLTPVWMQIAHLLTADLLWLALVLYAAARWPAAAVGAA